MYDMKDDTNCVVVSGRVIRTKELKDNRALITLHQKKTRDTYVRFICDKKLLPEFKLRDRLTITGHVIQTVLYAGKGRIDSQYFEASKVELTKTPVEEEFGITGKFYGEPINKIIVSGRLTAVTKKNGWMRYSVLAPYKNSKGELKLDNVIFFAQKEPDRPLTLSNGDRLCIVGHVSSAKKQIRGKDMYYEDMLADDVAKVE